MNITDFYLQKGEKPLDRLVTDGGFCGIFRTIACIGDSLSSGEFTGQEMGERTYHDFYEYSWGQFLARDAATKVYNFSRGGMNAKWYHSYAKDCGYFDVAHRAQAYIIALGVNDITAVIRKEMELGTIEDVDFADPARSKPSFIGYYANIVAKYKLIEPKAHFFFVTIPRTTTKQQDQARCELEDAHATLLAQLCERMEYCHLIDLRTYAPGMDEEYFENFYMDGHLTPTGYRLLARMIESYIDYIIRANPKAFAQAGFIGTPYHNSQAPW